MDVKKIVRVLRRIVKDKDFCLVRHLSSIDADFYTSEIPRQGVTTGRNPHPLFDVNYYRSRHLSEFFRGNPFCHYLNKGFKAGYEPGPYFNAEVYSEQSGWSPELGNPLEHYTKEGASKVVRPGSFFDIDWYLDKTPILQKIKTEALKHYLIHGAREGKSPIPIFNPSYYRKNAAHLPGSLEDPLSHYITFGLANDVRPGPWFDPSFYREKYNSEFKDISPLEHYLKKGVFQGNYTDSRIESLPYKPLISVVVPVYNAEPSFLNNCIRSVLYQAYPHWELCLVDDGSSREGLREQLEEWAQKDSRIKVDLLDRNQGISAATNAAVALAGGDYLGFLDNDDELTPDCLYYVADAICGTGADIFYTDEDLIGDDGRRFSLFQKPDFNRDLLLSHNYITHFVVISQALFEQTGGFRTQCDGAQDFDLMLRLTEKTDKICHIPKILYHWRATRTSTSINHDQKSYANEAGKRALAESLARREIEAVVDDTDINFYYRLRCAEKMKPKVSVLLWSGVQGLSDSSKIAQLQQKTRYENCQFILCASDPELNDLAPPDSADFLQESGFGVHSVPTTTPKALALHEAIMLSHGDYVVFLDESIIDLEAGWLDELVCSVYDDQTGIVCGRVSYNGEDGPSYTVPDITNGSGEYFTAFLHSCTRHMNGLHCPQQVSFCGWDVCLIRRNLYDKLGGFDHGKFPHLLAMADLTLRAAEIGYRTLYTPYSLVEGNIDKEDISLNGKEEFISEKKRFQKKWREKLSIMDPYYNPGILDENNIHREQFRSWLVGEISPGKP